jgi:2-methylcitrate dehydratase
LQDSRFHELSRKVRIKVDPICEEERLRLKNRAAVVTVVTTDGKRLEKRVQYSKGHPKNPFSNDELTEKFMDSVVPLLGSDRAKRIAETVWNIERTADASTLVKLSVKAA